MVFQNFHHILYNIRAANAEMSKISITPIRIERVPKSHYTPLVLFIYSVAVVGIGTYNIYYVYNPHENSEIHLDKLAGLYIMYGSIY